MPNPKHGTVVQDIPAAVRRFRDGIVQFRNDKGGTVSATIGRKAFTDAQLTNNFYAFLEELLRLRPKGVPGSDVTGYIERVSVSTTQGKGFPVAAADLTAAARAAAAGAAPPAGEA